MNQESEVFEILHTMRSMRRLKKDPVPLKILKKVLSAGVQAPSGQNTQPWSFLAITDKKDKEFFGVRYNFWLKERFGKKLTITKDKAGRSIAAAVHLGEHIHEAPILLMVLGKRDWPFKIPNSERKGLAPPSYGSVYPCVQNILIACRTLGLGASLTTMHQMFEDELHEHFEIPLDHGIVSVIPIGFPEGKFGTVSREPIETKTHINKWGNPLKG